MRKQGLHRTARASSKRLWPRLRPLGCPVGLGPEGHQEGKEQRSRGSDEQTTPRGCVCVADRGGWTDGQTTDVDHGMGWRRGPEKDPGVTGGAGRGGEGAPGKTVEAGQGCAPRTRLPEKVCPAGPDQGLAQGRGRRVGRAGPVGEEMGTWGGEWGPGCGAAIASSSASWRPVQLGVAPNHQFVLLGCSRVAPDVTSATQRRAHRQPSAAGNSCPQDSSPILGFLETSSPAQPEKPPS